MQGMRMKSHRHQFTKQEYTRKDQAGGNSPFWAAKKVDAVELSPKVIAFRRALAQRAAAAKKLAAAPKKKAAVAAKKKRAVAKAKPAKKSARKPAKKKAAKRQSRR